MLSDQVAAGARQPVARWPVWVSLEVVTGGFATGQALCAGPLLEYEHRLLRELDLEGQGAPRLLLNRYFLSDAGLARLNMALEEQSYEVRLPEEGALLAVAWLTKRGFADQARGLIEVIAPLMADLRFYPEFTASRRASGALVYVEDVGTTAQRLRGTRPNAQVLAQREAVGVWTPLYDRLIDLFLETVDGALPSALKDRTGSWQKDSSGRFLIEGGWPCARYPDGWRERAAALLSECRIAREVHQRCGRVERRGESLATLIDALDRILAKPEKLSGRDVGRVRLVLARYVGARGVPRSEQARQSRDVQLPHATAATHQEVAACVAQRLSRLPQHEGIDELGRLAADIEPGESREATLRLGARVPPSVIRKLERCVHGLLSELVQRGLIPSGEVLAIVLPQLTSGVRAQSFADDALRELYASVYRAFRRRRSLLLLDLQKQVQLEELPWVKAIELHRRPALSTVEVAKRALAEVSALSLRAFPHVITPNKLLQELAALAKSAGITMPFTEELAADIFMGAFSSKYVDAVRLAGEVLHGSLYARYYAIDYDNVVVALASGPASARRGGHGPDGLVRLCAARADVTLDGYSTAVNGQVIEQQQILTTHNLVAMVSLPGVKEGLEGHWHELSRRCFDWVLQHLQLPDSSYRVELVNLKNAAYAWRQMVFFLSMDANIVSEFLKWADDRLATQPAEFRLRFRPALIALARAAFGHDFGGSASVEGRTFLGWTSQRHWLMKARP